MRGDELYENECGIVERIDASSTIQKKLLQQGIYPSRRICFIKAAPLGTPLLFEVEGTYFSIRKQDAHRIIVRKEMV